MTGFRRKRSTEALGIFGGEPLFSTPRPIGQLASPEVDSFLALLEQAFGRRWLANGGPLVQRLELRLAEYHGARHCVALANAGLGIIMLLQIFSKGRRGEVIMPAFSYPGLPHFARWAGQQPRFCEVEAYHHCLEPMAVADAINDRTIAILAVCNFHSPGDIDGLVRLARDRDVPILFDSVNALGSTYRGRPLGPFGCAEVYSLHATKLLNGFEGGYITTDDDGLAAKLRWQRNFCVPGLAPTEVGEIDETLGLNAKLNEVHAAMALLSLDGVNETIGRNKARFEAYREICRSLPGLELLTSPEGPEEQRNYTLNLVEIGRTWPLSRDQTVALLRAEGAVIAPYYSPPLHLSSHATPDLPPPKLPVSEALADRFVQLPSGELVSVDDIAAIGELLSYVAIHGDEIRGRLAMKPLP
jgi:dTDP-4-amino-4,6-dideoxygalactose transaminase